MKTTLRDRLLAYLELSKPRIVSMVLVTTSIGYFLGGRGVASLSMLLLTLFGTGMAAAGAAALNNYLEREFDLKMERTRRRAIPSGRLDPANALAYGVLMALAGVGLLVWQLNLLTGFIVLLTAFLYVLVYTPLKRLTWWNTSVGAIPGALPPVSGWTAASGEIEIGALVLFGILFTWQHPHFYAIAWMYRDDYREAGYRMLSVTDPSGQRLFILTILFSVLLMIISMGPALLGMTGALYLTGALIAGAFVLSEGLHMAQSASIQSARRLLRASIYYLPVLLLLISVDAVF